MKEVYEKGMEGVRVAEAGRQEMIGQTEERIKAEMRRGGGGWQDRDKQKRDDGIRNVRSKRKRR